MNSNTQIVDQDILDLLIDIDSFETSDIAVEQSIYLNQTDFDQAIMDNRRFNRMLKNIALGKYFPKNVKEVNEIKKQYLQ